MELRFVVPNMEKTFGNLEFAGENTTEQQRINGRNEAAPKSLSDTVKNKDKIPKRLREFRRAIDDIFYERISANKAALAKSCTL